MNDTQYADTLPQSADEIILLAFEKIGRDANAANAFLRKVKLLDTAVEEMPMSNTAKNVLIMCCVYVMGQIEAKGEGDA